jgi:hypothetical protein
MTAAQPVKRAQIYEIFMGYRYLYTFSKWGNRAEVCILFDENKGHSLTV